MPSSDAFSLRRSGLNEFLFATVGTEANGMNLSVVSVLARMGKDPWLEAGRLAKLPKSEATENLARSIAGMPTSIWPLQAAMAIAPGLVALLPAQSGKPAQGSAVPADHVRTLRFLAIGLVLLFVAGTVAMHSGVFTTSDTALPDNSSVTSSGRPSR